MRRRRRWHWPALLVPLLALAIALIAGASAGAANIVLNTQSPSVTAMPVGKDVPMIAPGALVGTACVTVTMDQFDPSTIPKANTGLLGLTPGKLIITANSRATSSDKVKMGNSTKVSTSCTTKSIRARDAPHTGKNIRLATSVRRV